MGLQEGTWMYTQIWLNLPGIAGLRLWPSIIKPRFPLPAHVENLSSCGETMLVVDLHFSSALFGCTIYFFTDQWVKDPCQMA